MKIRNLTLFGLVSFCSLFAEKQEEPDIAHVSESFGHIIGNHLKYLEITFDITQLTKGIQDAYTGKESPLSEKECIEAIRLLQEKNYKELAQKNLKEAEIFLEGNAKKPEIIALEKGKVQYQILAEGNGTQIKPHFAPFIRYKLKTLDSKVSESIEEEPVSLDETIEGLKAGLIGMKEGEKRVLYIHPDLSYGIKGDHYFPPNSLLIFEMELLKADTR